MRQIYTLVIEALLAYKTKGIDEILKEVRKKVSPNQWGLFQILFFGVLDWQSHLLAVLTSFSSLKVKKFREEDLYLFLIAIYSILFLDKPRHAVVNEAVEQMKTQNPKLVAMTNGILRNILREEDLEERIYGKMDLLPALEKKYGYPVETIKLFLQELGPEKTDELLASSKEAPRLDFLILGDEAKALDMLEKEGHEFVPLPLERAYQMIKTAKSLDQIEAYKQGQVYFQSFASQKVAFLIPQGKNLLDLCGSPGGKSFALLAKDPQREITICDVSEDKIDRINENIHRLNLSLDVQKWDALIENPQWFESFSSVLLDAPCSGTGVLHRQRGESKVKDLSDIIELIHQQRQMLDQAAKYVEEGGFLIYSTCSILKSENENQVDYFLKAHEEFKLVDLGPSLEESFYKTFPGKGEDGFFACLMEKKKV